MQPATTLVVEAVAGSLWPNVTRATSQDLFPLLPARTRDGRTDVPTRGCLVPYGHVHESEHTLRGVHVPSRRDRCAFFSSSASRRRLPLLKAVDLPDAIVELRRAGDQLLQRLAYKRKLEWLPPSGLLQIFRSSSPAYAAVELA
eukprot:scaffold135146_cov66-Phaeocystis_antarctica.AAC.4